MPSTDLGLDLVRMFVYGTMLQGERDHGLLAEAEFLGNVRTEPAFLLVDLGVFPALVAGGSVSVLGELYRMDKKLRYGLDLHQQWPVLFDRIQVKLEDGTLAEAYAMRDEQVRGKRRLKGGSWRDRFAPRPRPRAGGAIVAWARKRFDPE